MYGRQGLTLPMVSRNPSLLTVCQRKGNVRKGTAYREETP
jgi:hypothetical protein